MQKNIIFKKIILSIMIVLTILSLNIITSGCKKTENEPLAFKVLQLTDPQFISTLKSSADEVNSITTLINTTSPDLIVITGDLVSNALLNGFIYQEFIDFLDTFKIPYAIAFGNHDGEGLTKKAALADIVKGGEYSVFQYGPEITGVGNYIYNVNNPSGGIAWSLVMFDSNEYDENDDYDYIHEDQVNWYRDSIESLKNSNGGTINSLAFFHIPLPEFAEAWALKGTDAVTYHFGDKREEECPSPTNSGLFSVMKELDSTRGIFVGHDHVNDYSITYQGIRLTYGLKTTDNSYDQEGVRGGLLITLTETDYTVEQIFCD